MLENQIQEIRKFNRFYTSFIGVLNKKYLSSKYTLPELRVIHEIYLKEGITAREITEQLRIDKSYLSRIIYQFEQKQLISRHGSKEDGRVAHLYLTAAGKRLFEDIDKRSQDHVKEIMSAVSDSERKELVNAMKKITSILTKKQTK